MSHGILKIKTMHAYQSRKTTSQVRRKAGWYLKLQIQLKEAYQDRHSNLQFQARSDSVLHMTRTQVSTVKKTQHCH